MGSKGALGWWQGQAKGSQWHEDQRGDSQEGQRWHQPQSFVLPGVCSVHVCPKQFAQIPSIFGFLFGYLF